MWIELRLQQSQLGELQCADELGLPQFGCVTITQGRDAEIHCDPDQKYHAPVEDAQGHRIQQDVRNQWQHGCLIDGVEPPHRRHRHEVHDRGEQQTEHQARDQYAGQKRRHAKAAPAAPSHEAAQAVREADRDHVEQCNLQNRTSPRHLQRHDGVVNLAETIDAPAHQLAGPICE